MSSTILNILFVLHPLITNHANRYVLFLISFIDKDLKLGDVHKVTHWWYSKVKQSSP